MAFSNGLVGQFLNVLTVHATTYIFICMTFIGRGIYYYMSCIGIVQAIVIACGAFIRTIFSSYAYTLSVITIVIEVSITRTASFIYNGHCSTIISIVYKVTKLLNRVAIIVFLNKCRFLHHIICHNVGGPFITLRNNIICQCIVLGAAFTQIVTISISKVYKITKPTPTSLCGKDLVTTFLNGDIT